MKDQHKKITGYRDLSQSEIDAINAIKAQGEEIGALIQTLSQVEIYDQRWVSIGKTHLQQGIMALVRAIAKPESF